MNLMTSKPLLPAPLLLDESNIADAIRGLPRITAHALRFALGLRYGSVTIGLPNGRWVRIEGREPGPDGTVVFKDVAAAASLAKGGDLAFAEAYLNGQWESPDLTAFLQVFFCNHEMIAELTDGMPLVRYWHQLRHWLRRNTKRNARRNIHAHYDLGNAFFAAWLDPGMTYSSALFDAADQPLSDAQDAKYSALARRIGIEPSHEVLEIGCGWGGFAEFAAGELGASITGITISQAQYDYARERVFRAGLNERVTLKLQDYRDERGLYDRIVSIEMIEAVGRKYWPVYFDRLRACLRPGGRAGIQAITMSDEHLANDRGYPDFVQAYIFPGGLLPAPGIMKETAARAGLEQTDDECFGSSYARTLEIWRRQFLDAWPAIAPLGFDERFRRLWTYYLSYCEAGFLAGTIDVRQTAFVRA